MSTRIPEPASADEAEGIPDRGDVEPSQAAAGETVDYGNSPEPPHDTAMAVDDFGTTPAEQHDGESLEGRIRREVPDVTELDVEDARAGQGVGRLVEPDEGAREDVDKDLIATDVGTDLGGYSAEEAAMHVEPEH